MRRQIVSTMYKNTHYYSFKNFSNSDWLRAIGVRAGGARRAAAPPNFGQLSFLGQQEKIWAKADFKDVSMFI